MLPANVACRRIFQFSRPASSSQHWSALAIARIRIRHVPERKQLSLAGKQLSLDCWKAPQVSVHKIWVSRQDGRFYIEMQRELQDSGNKKVETAQQAPLSFLLHAFCLSLCLLLQYPSTVCFQDSLAGSSSIHHQLTYLSASHTCSWQFCRHDLWFVLAIYCY